MTEATWAFRRPLSLQRCLYFLFLTQWLIFDAYRSNIDSQCTSLPLRLASLIIAPTRFSTRVHGRLLLLLGATTGSLASHKLSNRSKEHTHPVS